MMDRYCGSTFWDINKTWNTTNPDFTECFEDTALLWAPCLFLWVSSIFDVYINANPERVATSIISDLAPWLPAWTRLGVFKIFNVALLTCLEVITLCVSWFEITKDKENQDILSIPDVLWATPIILIITNFLSACLIVFHKTRCIHTSGPQLLYWLMMSIVHTLIFHTKLVLYKPEDKGTVILLGISLIVMYLQTFLFCWSDIPGPQTGGHTLMVHCDDGVRREECPILRASALSYVLFSWCTPLVRKGYKEPLTKDDLWELIPSVRATTVFRIFSKHFGNPNIGEIRSIYRNILKPLWKTCGWSFMIAVICRFVGCLLSFLPTVVMAYLIDFVENPSVQEWKGYLWASSLLAIHLIITLFVEQYFLHMFKCFVNIMSCLNMIIYKKSLRVSTEARKDKTTGEIVNLMSVDTEKIRILVYEADAFWSTPIQITVGIIMLWWQLGVSVFPGIGVLCSIIPINWFLVAASTKYQRAQMAKKDERIKVISEVLSGIQVIKLYAWEPSFQSQIQKIRSEEIHILKKRSIVQCIMQFVSDSIPFLVSIASFFTFVYTSDEEFDAKKAFTAVTLFNLLTDPITELPSCISATIDATVSFKRINAFLNAEEVDPKATDFKLQHGGRNGDKPAIEIINGSFAWEELSEASWQLIDIDLEVKAKKLTAVVGSVASGKSSLLSAILGDMKYFGKVIVRGKVAYAPQIPWILNGTLRENICFGLPYEREKYDKIVDACCLTPDLEILPAGDMTEIGEKGINLSGGQKQRVSLARLAYSGADILLMDDVLSAVDAHVGKHIFDKLLSSNGLLAGKTRLLCTHSYNFLAQCDNIVLMEGGRILECDTYVNLMDGGGNFPRLLANQKQTGNDGNNRSMDTDEKPVDKSSTSLLPHEDENRRETGKLIEEERLETGDVKLSVFLAYLRAMKYPFVISFVLFFALSEGLALGRSVVLTKWTDNSTKTNQTFKPDRSETDKKRRAYITEYALLGVTQSLFYLFGFFILAIASLRATKRLHNNMLKRILRAPMSFFNVTLLGRIVNRFSSDVEAVDRSLPSQVGDWICHLFKFCGVIVAICYGNVYFICFIVPLSIIYYYLQRHYIACMQQLQRILNAFKSPIYSQFQETLSGTSTIRAYKAEDRFCRMLADKIDSYNRVLLPHLIVRRWLSIRLGALGSLIIFVPALFAVIWRNTTSSSIVGLSISYALQVTSILSWLVKVTSYLQYNFVSVERILEYSSVAQEASFKTKGENESDEEESSSQGLSVFGGRFRRFNPSWPENGEIIFDDYETRYRPGLDLVLKHFNCTINPGEKIGIVGRTGAGKSSLTLALFRIIESTNGRIVIDGVDISKIGLHDVRRRLTVIPQDPVLFSRSLRLNLDPFNDYEDEKLWEALKLAHLNEFVSGMPEGLQHSISEGGDNLSVGQRQLVCLARAILRKSSVLVLDEATASVDNATDDLIQRTIREHFDGCTILNVAHRLNTVLDSSRILVLDRGQIVEFDKPQILLANQNSYFYGMAKDAGII